MINDERLFDDGGGLVWYVWFGLVCPFSRKRSEGFPFIVGGLGVGPVFASCLSCRRRVVVASSSSTR